MTNYNLRITYHSLHYSPTFISSQLKKQTSRSINLTKTLIKYIVLSRLDHCSSLLNQLPAKSIAQLNQIIRYSICTTYCIMYHSTITHHQSSHMWLPFLLMDTLCVLFIIHKSIYSFNPRYIFIYLKNVQYYPLIITKMLCTYIP